MNSCRTYSIPNLNKQIPIQAQAQTHSLLIPHPRPSAVNIQPQILSLLPSSSGICVICRFRPINDLEKSFNNKIIARIVSNHQVDILSDSEFYVPSFQFDNIFPMTSTQNDIYTSCSQPIIQSVLDGYNGTILAYGQTASGKTHTMQGIVNDDELKGVIPRAIHQIFSYVNSQQKTNEDHISITMTMIEIYMERVNDLLHLSKKNLNIRERKDKKHYIDDVSEHVIQSENAFLELFNQGVLNRTIGSTQMNYNSSRSHCIVMITISQKNIKSRITKRGRLYLVDLAGSEKASKTGVTGLNLEEAKNINKSLSTLGLIIKTLTDGTSTHIPYRESKLTRILSESLGGNSKTCLILTCSPSSFNEAETLSTLRFGMRAKKIKNKPIINKELSLGELKEKLEEMTQLINDKNNRIKELEKKIRINGINSEMTIEDDPSDVDIKETLRDITIVDKDNEKLVNELNQRLKEKDEEYQKEIEKLLETIDMLKGTLLQNKIRKEYSFNNLKIKNVFHTIYNTGSNTNTKNDDNNNEEGKDNDNNSEENNTSSLIILKEDKGINTLNCGSQIAISTENSFSFLISGNKKGKPVELSQDFSYHFCLIFLCIIFSCGIHLILEYI